MSFKFVVKISWGRRLFAKPIHPGGNSLNCKLFNSGAVTPGTIIASLFSSYPFNKGELSPLRPESFHDGLFHWVFKISKRSKKVKSNPFIYFHWSLLIGKKLKKVILLLVLIAGSALYIWDSKTVIISNQ